MQSVPPDLIDLAFYFRKFCRRNQRVDLQNQFVGAACGVKRQPRLLAQQSLRMDGSQNPKNECQTFQI
jgi:hypothetical protein